MIPSGLIKQAYFSADSDPTGCYLETVNDTDAQLLRRYSEQHSEAAFAELVGRYVDLVYSAALRQVGGDPHHARDVAQTVFTDLARKASALSRHSALIGWLYTSTHFAAAKLVRAEQRRRRHEQSAHDMPHNSDPFEQPADWERLRPVLDATMQCLNDRERASLLLRFFDRRPLAEVGVQLGISENAAQKTAERALAKLRRLLARRGITSTSTALALVLTEQAVAAAPSHVATIVTAAAMTNATSAGGLAGAISTSLAMGKIKTGIISAVVLGTLGATFVEVRANRSLQRELRGLQAADQGWADESRVHQELTRALQNSSPGNPEVAELARVEARTTKLAARPAGVVDAAMEPVANIGRATPEAAFVTLCAAENTGDLDGVAGLVAFRGDSPEMREKFWANFPERLRARYQTPEKLVAAALFGVRDGVPSSNPLLACQPLTTEELNPFGAVRTQFWVRNADGSEGPSGEEFQRGPAGWAVALRSLSDAKFVSLIKSHVDPVTGELRAPKSTQ